jgi:hypothetical protein
MVNDNPVTETLCGADVFDNPRLRRIDLCSVGGRKIRTQCIPPPRGPNLDEIWNVPARSGMNLVTETSSR